MNAYNMLATSNFVEKLINNSLVDAMFFANSMSGAVEYGFKIAEVYQDRKDDKNCHRILTFRDIFYRRSFLTCTTDYRQEFSELLNPYIDWYYSIKLSVESIEKTISNGIGVV